MHHYTTSHEMHRYYLPIIGAAFQIYDEYHLRKDIQNTPMDSLENLNNKVKHIKDLIHLEDKIAEINYFQTIFTIVAYPLSIIAGLFFTSLGLINIVTNVSLMNRGKQNMDQCNRQMLEIYKKEVEKDVRTIEDYLQAHERELFDKDFYQHSIEQRTAVIRPIIPALSALHSKNEMVTNLFLNNVQLRFDEKDEETHKIYKTDRRLKVSIASDIVWAILNRLGGLPQQEETKQQWIKEMREWQVDLKEWKENLHRETGLLMATNFDK